MDNNITLKTPIENLEMPDRLRNRLKLLRCKTFRDAMEMSVTDWENVTPKVINAMKRFQQTHAKQYRELAQQTAPKNSVHTPAPNDERRFFVANNVLNSYIASGRMFDPGTTLEQKMEEIMSTADAFLSAYDCREIVPGDEVKGKEESGEASQEERSEESLKEAREADFSVPESKPSRKPRRAGRTAKKATEQPADLHPIAEVGTLIKLTNHHGKRRPNATKFQVGDEVTVTSIKKLRTGKVVVQGTCAEKQDTFDSTKYDWELVAQTAE